MRITHDPGRFVAHVEGAEASIEYVREGDVLDVRHTFTPPALRGRDIASALTRAVVDYARAEGLVIRPTCPYTRRWAARHPELAQLFVTG
jgi:predicted GNAT family acetyltransferase